jgi:tetratricopeptide (TPR) repeat protein
MRRVLTSAVALVICFLTSDSSAQPTAGDKPAPRPPWATAKPPQPPSPPPPPPSSASPAPAAASPSSVIPVPNPSPSTADVAKAKTLFTAGGKSFEKGDYVAAIQSFERSYSLSGRPNILFSLGQAYKKRFAESQDPQHRAAAIELYRAYLAAVPSGGRRADAVRGLEDLGQRTGDAAPQPGTPEKRKTLLSIDSTTPGALISVDGGEPAPPQVDVEVEPGRHTIKVTARGFVEQEFVMQALVGQTEAETFNLEEAPVEITLKLPSGATVHVDGSDRGESSKLTLAPGRRFVSVSKPGHKSFGQILEAEGGETRTLEIDLETTTQRDASIGLMAGGGAAMIGGGVLLGLAFLAQSKAQDIDAERETSGITQERNEEFDLYLRRRNELRAAGVVVGGLGGLAFLGGGALFLFDRQGPLPLPVEDRSKKKPVEAPVEVTSVLPVVSGSEGGLVVCGRF